MSGPLRKRRFLAAFAAALAIFAGPAFPQSVGGGGGSGAIVLGTTPVAGTCTTGQYVYNNAGVYACQTLTGGGNISTSGTPLANQIAVFASGTTIAGAALNASALTALGIAPGTAGGFATFNSLGSGAFAAAYVLPSASTTTNGGIKVDGTTLTVNAGVASVTLGAGGAAAYSDGRITGALSASATTLPANFTASSLTSAAGGAFGTGAYAAAYSLPTATTTVLGGVKPDNSTIKNTSGVLSVNYGTTATSAAVGNDSRITNAVQTGGALGTPSSGTLTNATGLPIAGLSGLGFGVAGALAVAPLASGSFVQQNGSIANGNCLVWSTTSGLTDAGAPCLGATSHGYWGASYPFVSTDSGTVVLRGYSAKMTDSLPAASSAGFTAPFTVTVQSQSAYIDTVTSTTSTVGGFAPGTGFVIPAYGAVTFISDGANWNVVTSSNDGTGTPFFPGLNVSSDNTAATGLTVSNTSTGGHAYAFQATGSAAGAGYLSIYDGTSTNSAFQLYGGASSGSNTYISQTAKGTYNWSCNASIAGVICYDTGLSRISAGVIAAGNGYQGDVTGAIKATTFLAAPAVPTFGTCGTTPTTSAGSSNNGGQITFGTGTVTSCSVVFSTATVASEFQNYAYVTVTPASSLGATTYYISAQSKTGFTITTSASAPGAVFNYHVVGN